MKKALALVIALVMVFALFAGCSKSDSKAETGKTDNTPSGSSSASASTGTAAKPGTSVEAAAESTHTETVDLASEEVSVHPSDDATFRFALNTDIGYLTQTGHAFGSAGTGTLFFGESLFRWNSDTCEVEPFIATGAEWIDDTTLRVKIRDDITSVLGDPFTANDILFSFQWGNETAALAQYFNFFDMDNTKVVDDYTIDLAVKAPYPFLTLDLCHGVYHVACEKSIETIGGKEAAAMNPNGLTGPYKMTKLDEVSQVCYAERRDDYWGVMPYYKYLEIYSVTDANTRAMGIEAGDYDFAMNPSSASVAAADGKSSKGWYIAGAGRFCNFAINSDHEPLNIKEVRQAMALAINYEAMVQIAGGGNGMVSDSAFSSPINTFSYTEAKNPDNCFLGRTDLELAKQKLADAGYADGFTINCYYKSTDPVISNCADLLKNQLGQISINLELQPIDNATFNSITRTADWDTHLSTNGNPNPKRTLTPLDPRLSPQTATGWAGASWADGLDVGTLIDKCVQTVDDAERMKAFEEFNDLCREYVPQIILYCPYIQFLSSPAITNVPVGSQGGPECCRIFPAEYIEG